MKLYMYHIYTDNENYIATVGADSKQEADEVLLHDENITHFSYLGELLADDEEEEK